MTEAIINVVTKQEIKDKDDFERAMNDYIITFHDEVKKALYQEGREIMRKSSRLCPIDTGTLRRSRHVDTAREDKMGNIYLDLSYGTNYAVYVHENLEAHHKPPTQAKFLEQPAREALPNLYEKIIMRVNKMMEAKR